MTLRRVAELGRHRRARVGKRANCVAFRRGYSESWYRETLAFGLKLELSSQRASKLLFSAPGAQDTSKTLFCTPLQLVRSAEKVSAMNENERKWENQDKVQRSEAKKIKKILFSLLYGFFFSYSTIKVKKKYRYRKVQLKVVAASTTADIRRIERTVSTWETWTK